MISKSKHYLALALVVMISFVGVGASYFVGRNISRGDSITQFILTQNVDRGHPIEGKYVQVNVPSNVSVNPDHLILDEKELKGKVATMDMYKSQPITITSVSTEEHLERNFDFSMPITVEGAIANTLKVDDKVAIKVKFEDNRPDACVVPIIDVAELRTEVGGEIVDQSTVPGFVLFHTNDEESADLNAASKEGSLYVVRYRDISQPKLEKTYSRPGGATPNDNKKKEGN